MTGARPGDPPLPDVEFERLSGYLKALSNPNRLELLHQLKFPRTAGEISLTPKRSESDGNPDRLISRQAVERHLESLLGINAVRVQRSTREGRPVDEYVVNHPMLFAVVEEMRKLTHLQSHAHIDPLATRSAAEARGSAPAPPARAKGPRLILVAGVWEGKAYPLDPKGPEPTWVIGRRETVEIRLDYDPYVSQENTAVVFDGGRYHVQDLPQNRNGTLLNYDAMPRGGRAALESGDLIGAGRSLLLFRER